MTITYDAAARYVERNWITPEQVWQARADINFDACLPLLIQSTCMVHRFQAVLERAAELVDTDDLDGVDHDDLAATLGRGLALVAAWTEAQR